MAIEDRTVNYNHKAAKPQHVVLKCEQIAAVVSSAPQEHVNVSVRKVRQAIRHSLNSKCSAVTSFCEWQIELVDRRTPFRGVTLCSFPAIASYVRLGAVDVCTDSRSTNQLRNICAASNSHAGYSILGIRSRAPRWLIYRACHGAATLARIATSYKCAITTQTFHPLKCT